MDRVASHDMLRLDGRQHGICPTGLTFPLVLYRSIAVEHLCHKGRGYLLTTARQQEQ